MIIDYDFYIKMLKYATATEREFIFEKLTEAQIKELNYMESPKNKMMTNKDMRVQ